MALVPSFCRFSQDSTSPGASWSGVDMAALDACAWSLTMRKNSFLNAFWSESRTRTCTEIMSVIDQPSAQASNMSVIDHQPRPRSVANFFRQSNYDNYVSSRLLEPGFVRKSILHEVATDWLWSMARMGCCHESIRWISRLLSPNLGPIDFKLHRCKISDKPNHCTLMSATRCKLPWKMLSMELKRTRSIWSTFLGHVILS